MRHPFATHATVMRFATVPTSSNSIAKIGLCLWEDYCYGILTAAASVGNSMLRKNLLCEVIGRPAVVLRGLARKRSRINSCERCEGNE